MRGGDSLQGFQVVAHLILLQVRALRRDLRLFGHLGGAERSHQARLAEREAREQHTCTGAEARLPPLPSKPCATPACADEANARPASACRTAQDAAVTTAGALQQSSIRTLPQLLRAAARAPPPGGDPTGPGSSGQQRPAPGGSKAAPRNQPAVSSRAEGGGGGGGREAGFGALPNLLRILTSSAAVIQCEWRCGAQQSRLHVPFRMVASCKRQAKRAGTLSWHRFRPSHLARRPDA